METSAVCPRCRSAAHVRRKLVLVEENPELNYRGTLLLREVKLEHLGQGALKQFVGGYFCDACECGFLSEEMLKEPRRRAVILADGWHIVQADGTLGPAQSKEFTLSQVVEGDNLK